MEQHALVVQEAGLSLVARVRLRHDPSDRPWRGRLRTWFGATGLPSVWSSAAW